MRKCQNCGKSFPYWVTIEGKPRNLKNRHYCLACSPFGLHNTRPLGQSTLWQQEGTKVCSACHKEKPIQEFYKKGKYPHAECRTCFNSRSKVRAQKIKARAVRYKGGKCMRCGFQGHIAVFDFHHLDPSQKDFSIGQFKNRSFDKIKEELDKCILLCANCHRELEALGDDADWSFVSERNKIPQA